MVIITFSLAGEPPNCIIAHCVVQWNFSFRTSPERSLCSEFGKFNLRRTRGARMNVQHFEMDFHFERLCSYDSDEVG